MTNLKQALKMISKLVLAGALLAMLGAQFKAAQAHVGLSEVWSETEGLKLKYSTNHGDLLSTKGSEMSLSSDQRHRAVEPVAAGGGAESGAESAQSNNQEGPSLATSEESSSEGGNSETPTQQSSSESGSDEQQGEGNNEEGAADSRKTEKVVPSTAGRVVSYSSLGQSASPGASSSSSRQFKSSASTSRGSPESTPTTSNYDFSGSSPEDQMVNDNGEVSPASSGDSSEQSSADSDPADGPLANEAPATSSGASKFRQPGRLFKEAVKMGQSQQQPTQQKPKSTSKAEDSDSDDDDESSSADSPQKSSEAAAGQTKSAKDEAAAANDESDDFNGENENPWGSAMNRQAGRKVASLQDATNDYEQRPPFASHDGGMSSADPTEGGQEQPEQTYRSAMPTMGLHPAHMQHPRPVSRYTSSAIDEDDEAALMRSAPSPMPQGLLYPDGSNQAGRPLYAASSQRSPVGTAGNQRGSTPTSSTTTAGPNANKPYKQLAYFRSVNEQTPSAPRHSPVRMNSAASRELPAPDNSPDSVRDNFISPGHYPGSMPHLTQAASEVKGAQSDSSSAGPAGPTGQPKPVEFAAKEAQQEPVKPSSQAIEPENSQGQNLVASDTNNLPVKQPVQPLANIAAAEPEQKSIAEARSMAVTPMPEAQQESQQIMAPILVTTTTMAPMLPSSSTSAPTSSSSTTTTTSAPSPSSATSQTPALKRFKFRKYR